MLAAIPPMRCDLWRHDTTKRQRVRDKLTFSDQALALPAAARSGGFMTDKPEPLEKLVKVFDTDVESEAMVGGLLESDGIEAIISNREAPQDVLPGVGGVVILVREEQAENALATIEEYRAHPTTDEDEAVSEEPAEP
jgi:hypothetical protein